MRPRQFRPTAGAQINLPANSEWQTAQPTAAEAEGKDVYLRRAYIFADDENDQNPIVVLGLWIQMNRYDPSGDYVTDEQFKHRPRHP